MSDWARDIRIALERGKSDRSAWEVMGWIIYGDAVMFVGDEMTASARPIDGKCQLCHIAGKWNRTDAEWFRISLRARMQAWGVTDFVDEGRSGWPRFLQMKGFQL